MDIHVTTLFGGIDLNRFYDVDNPDPDQNMYDVYDEEQHPLGSIIIPTSIINSDDEYDEAELSEMLTNMICAGSLHIPYYDDVETVWVLTELDVKDGAPVATSFAFKTKEKCLEKKDDLVHAFLDRNPKYVEIELLDEEGITQVRTGSMSNHLCITYSEKNIE